MIELNYSARHLPLWISDSVFILPARIRDFACHVEHGLQEPSKSEWTYLAKLLFAGDGTVGMAVRLGRWACRSFKLRNQSPDAVASVA